MRTHLRSIVFVIGFVLSLLANEVPASPLKTIDLASDSAWSVRRELDSGFAPCRVPTELTVRDTANRWIDLRRRIDIPNLAAGQVTILRLLSINDGGEIFVDGKSAGKIDYGLFPARIDLSDFVTPGKPVELTIRCFDRANYYVGGAFPSDNNSGQFLGVPRGISLEIYPQAYVSDLVTMLSVMKDRLDYTVCLQNRSPVERRVTLHAVLSSASNAHWIYPAIADQSVTLPPLSGTKVAGSVRWGLGLGSYWWPNIPFDENYRAQLHLLSIQVIENEATENVASQQFGFCEYGEGPSYYTINGVRIFEFMDSAQEHIWTVRGWPDGFQAAYQYLPAWGDPSRACDTWKRYQRLGVNTFRIHNSAAGETMLEAADETGMMLVGESGLRGYEHPEEQWDYLYKRAAIEGMVRAYRAHPSIIRYSLDNEYPAVTKDPKIAAALIDAATAEDPTRPLSFSQDKDPREGVFYGSDGKAHAWVMQHYYQPHPTPTSIVGIEESHWDRNGTTRNELIGCARDAILDRLRGYAVFGPWTLSNYWCNFVDGGSFDSGTVNPKWKVKDRHDGVDGWNSDIIRFVQNCYSIYAAADVDLIQNHLNTEQAIFSDESVPVLKIGVVTLRALVVFNNSLASHAMSIVWTLRADSPQGRIIDQGETPTVAIAPGEHATPNVTLVIPQAAGMLKAYFVLETRVDGKVRFHEDRYYFRIAAE